MPYTVVINVIGEAPLFGPLVVESAEAARSILVDEITRHAETLEVKFGAAHESVTVNQAAIAELRKQNLTSGYRVYLPASNVREQAPISFQIFATDSEVTTSASDTLQEAASTRFGLRLPDDAD